MRLISASALLLALAGGADARPLVLNDFWSIRSNWAMSSDDVYVGSVAGCYEGLTRVSYEGKLEPWLASAYHRVEPTVWEITLREGVLFQDGTPMDAEAVAFSLATLLRSETPARAFSPRLFKSVEVAGPDKIRITTAEPLAMLPAHLAAPSASILSKAAYKENGGIDPVNHCTGPFVITAVDQKQGLKLKANPIYWGEKPKIAEGEIRFVLDANTRAVQARSGEADISRLLSVTSVPRINESGVAEISQATTPRTTMLMMNNRKKPLDDVRVRQAIRAAIDNAAISAALFEGMMPPANGLFRPGDAWAPKELSSAYDVEKARALLAEAGVAEGSLKLEIIAYSERPEFKDIAAAVQQMLAEVGIEATIRVGQYNVVEGDLVAGRYDLALLSRSYLNDVLDPIGLLSSDFSCSGSFNIAQYCSPEVDGLIAGARGEDDDTARYNIYREVAQKLNDDAAFAPIIHVNTFDAVGRSVEGFRPHPLNNYYFTPQLSMQ